MSHRVVGSDSAQSIPVDPTNAIKSEALGPVAVLVDLVARDVRGGRVGGTTPVSSVSVGMSSVSVR